MSKTDNLDNDDEITYELVTETDSNIELPIYTINSEPHKINDIGDNRCDKYTFVNTSTEFYSEENHSVTKRSNKTTAYGIIIQLRRRTNCQFNQ